VVLRGDTSVGEGAAIDAWSVLDDTYVGAGARVLASCVCSGARIGPGAHVGPMAHLRAEADIREGARVGNFVEIKKCVLGAGAKANHLSYLGDAVIGEKANIGAGTITCNYDGFSKHRTVVGARAFVGSNTAIVAPSTIGDGAIIGAGSVVVGDVPADALYVARGRPHLVAGRATEIRARLARKPRSNES
jgi:bifunctional UDP-N-acetylglucosamine pyrophosphorylase/glucosamine-1-phosphate N-acetyltransferase